MKSDEKLLEKPIFFIGPGRSGSTIISEFLMAHELLAWPTNYLEMNPKADWSNHLRVLFDNRLWRLSGEKAQINRTKLFNNYLPRPAEAYPFWEHLTRKDINFSRGFLLGEVAAAEERRHIRDVFRALVSTQRRRRLAVKLTGPGRIGYLKSIFPDAQFINIIRDPDATVRSLLNVPFWQNQGKSKLWWLGAYSDSEIEYYESIRHDPVASTRFQLDKILSTTLQEAEYFNADMITVQYEEFVHNPHRVIERILRFACLPESKWIALKLRSTSIRDQNRIPNLNINTENP